MNRCVLLLAVAFVVLVVGGVGQTKAEPFVNPPELNWSPPWQSQFPYPRNIDWSFDTVSPVGGPTPNGTPGAVYEGWLDPELMSSDVVNLNGSVQWYPTLTIGPNTYTGVIGIDNTLGQTMLTGTAKFLLDNTPMTTPWVKHVWIETTSASVGGGWGVGVSAPESDTSLGYHTWSTIGSITAPEYLDDFGFTLDPNPMEETVTFSFDAPAGGYALLDTAHIATECVPEPSTLALCAVVALGLIACVRRRRGAKA